MSQAHGRIIIQGNIPASYGLAVSEHLMQTHQESPDTSPILYQHNFDPPCVLVGRFEDIDSQVNFREIEIHGLSVNRRFTGGGTLLMRAHSSAFSLITDLKSLGVPMQPEAIFEKVGHALVEGFGTVGVEIRFEPRNRMMINGKLLTILEISCDEKNVLFLSFSFRHDDDFDEQAIVTSRPDRDLAKHIAELKETWTTVTDIGPRRLGPERLTEAVTKGCEKLFNMPFEPAVLSEEEKKKIEELEKTRYRTSEWMFRRRPMPDMTGQRVKRTDAGSIQIYLSRNGTTLRNIMICGDFSSTALTIRDLEAKLKDIQIDRETILNIIKEELARRNHFIVGLSEDYLANAILDAADKALRVEEAHRGGLPPSPPQMPAERSERKVS